MSVVEESRSPWRPLRRPTLSGVWPPRAGSRANVCALAQLSERSKPPGALITGTERINPGSNCICISYLKGTQLGLNKLRVSPRRSHFRMFLQVAHNYPAGPRWEGGWRRHGELTFGVLSAHTAPAGTGRDAREPMGTTGHSWSQASVSDPHRACRRG